MLLEVTGDLRITEADWVSAYAERLGEYAGPPASRFVACAEEQFAELGEHDPIEAANAAIQMWENEGADMAKHFEAD